MRDIPPTPAQTLSRARAISTKNGVRYAFTGNVHDPAGQATYCHQCRAQLIGRDWYEITAWHLTNDGKCKNCGTACAGRFDRLPGTWGSKRMPVSMTTASGGPSDTNAPLYAWV